MLFEIMWNGDFCAMGFIVFNLLKPRWWRMMFQVYIYICLINCQINDED